MHRITTVDQALDFVREHGVVLASAKGPAPRLTEAIVGTAIKGSWWAHPQSHRIYAILSEVAESEQILVCRLINGRITLVHRHLWPSLIRLAGRFAPEQLAQVGEAHTASGRHVTHAVPYPEWVPPEVMEQARRVREQDALRALGSWVQSSRRDVHAT
jgi:hypothetical protein